MQRPCRIWLRPSIRALRGASASYRNCSTLALLSASRSNGNQNWASHAPRSSLHQSLKKLDKRFTTSTQISSILNSARVHGIKSFEQLIWESDVGSTENVGSKLVDQPANRDNLFLWYNLLQIQHYQNGIDGVKAIWRGMKYRGHQVILESGNQKADDIWQTFVSVGLEDSEFLRQICLDCINQNFVGFNAYVDIIGGLLRSQSPQHATDFSKLFRKTSVVGSSELMAIFDAACQSKNPNALRSFSHIFRQYSDIKLYSQITTQLWENERSSDAFIMHSFLLSKRDLPPTFGVVEPFIQFLARQGGKLEPFLRDLDAAGVSFNAQARRLYARERSRFTGFSAETLNIIASRTMGVRSTKLTDSFVARALATTKSLSFESVISGLRMLGLIEVGPITVRQMIVTAVDSKEVCERFQKLKELEVDTGSSAFVRLAKLLSLNNQDELLKSIALTDLHHEVFEDSQTQRKLLTEFYRTKDWTQINRTLAILNDGEDSIAARERHNNLLLRSALKVDDFEGVLEIMTNMRKHQQRVSSAVIRYMFGKFFPTNQELGLRHKADFDSTGFLIGLWQEILVAGTHIRLLSWRIPISDLGRQGRFDELSNLIRWLISWYRPGGLHIKVLGKPLTENETDLSRLFTEHFQGEIVYWDFIATTYRVTSLNRLDTYLGGAKLLKLLRDDCSLSIDVARIRQICKRNMQCLLLRLSRNRRTPSPRNVKGEESPLEQYLTMFDELWETERDALEQSDVDTDTLQQYVAWEPKTSLSRSQSRHALNRTTSSANQPLRTEPELRLGEQNKEDESPDQESERGPVIYRDLYHASWEDYKKS